MTPSRRRLLALAALTPGAALAPAALRAQPRFPSRPVTIVVPYAAGGGADITARLLAQRLPATLGQPVVVENRTGANGVLGAEVVARAAPDGHTLGMVVSSHVINKAVLASLPFDPVADFSPVLLVARTQMVLVVPSSLPVSTVPELVSLLRTQSGQAAYASPGAGSNVHVFLEWFVRRAGLDMLHVPYRGSAAAHPDLIAGRVAFTIDTYAAVRQHLDQGRLRVLAFGGPDRYPGRPELPTIAEAAGIPGYAAYSWSALLGPRGVPAEVVARLHAEFTAALAIPEVRERLDGLGAEVAGGTPETLRALMAEDERRFTALVREFGIRADS
jgi:tripartite-type tricarboxylate transporter receptor subunit TctC